MIRLTLNTLSTALSSRQTILSCCTPLAVRNAWAPQPENFFYDEDIYVSHKRNGEWTKGTNIGRPVNATGHDATISLTADGKKLYIYRHKKAGGLYVTEFSEEDQKWKEPRAIQKPLNSKFYEASICQSADSTTMFFTSDRPGGFGGRDIYMVQKEGKKWGDPQNLGSNVNTAFDEDAPYFHPDGKTLYYSSNGPNSMGGFDIFVTEMDTSSETGWLGSLNMGTPVNTPDDDIYFVLAANGKSGYYSSGMEGGLGEKDIYHIKFPYYPYPRRYHIVEVAGLVKDVNTLETLNAKVKLVDIETNEVLDSIMTASMDSSQYYFILEPQRTYSLEVSADGYDSANDELTTPELADEDVFLKKNMFLVKPEVPPVVAEEVPNNLPELQHIYYDFDKDKIRSDAADELDRVAELMAQNEDLDVQIMSHTDWYGTYAYNVDLSNRRADQARAYLQRKGVNATRIKTGFFSENQPLETNENDKGRQFNRRSEFRLVRDNDVVLNSVKLRTGVEGVRIDRATPQGEAGFDNPDGLVSGTVAESSSDNADAMTGKDAIKNEWTSSTASGKDALKDAGNSSEGKDALKNEENSSSDAPSAMMAALNELELHHIYYDFDKYNLRQASKAQLDQVLDVLGMYPDLQLEIYGHTDAFGSVEYNQRLSENRAKSAYNYMSSTINDQNQLILNGFSELQPMDDNDSAGGRQNNRRVEFRIVQNGKVLVKSMP